MNLLPKWALANPFPAIHDFESLTVIDQTARIYGAMQTLIKEYNDFAEAANKQLASFTEDETEARKEFELQITKKMNEFLCSMEQYLKVNLDETATKVLIEGLSTGSIEIPTDKTFTKNNYPADAAAVGVLKSRIDALAALKEGSTTGDAELSDIRVGFMGEVYNNAGEAVRAQAKTINDNIDAITLNSGDPSIIERLNLWQNGTFDSGTLEPLYLYSTVDHPSVTDEETSRPGYALCCSCNGADRFGALRGSREYDPATGSIGDRYGILHGMKSAYIACMLNVKNYVSGRVGITAFNTNDVAISKNTDGWEMFSEINENTQEPGSEGYNKHQFVGAWTFGGKPPVMDAYIDDIVIIDMDYAKGYTKDQLDAAYIAWRKMKSITAKECMDEFAVIMDEYASNIGVTDSEFASPSGQPVEANGIRKNGQATARDLVKLACKCANTPGLSELFGIGKAGITFYLPEKTNYTFKRTFSVNTEFGNRYKIFGEKGGSWNTNGAYPSEPYACCYVAVFQLGEKVVCGCVGDIVNPNPENSVGSTIISEAMIELAEMCQHVIDGGEPGELTKSNYAAACVVPEAVNSMCRLADNENGSPRSMWDKAEWIYDYNKDGTFIPASATKMITALIAMEWMDLDEMLHVTAEDFATVNANLAGSGQYMNTRMCISVRSLLESAFLISSNQACSCLARNIGMKSLLRKRAAGIL